VNLGKKGREYITANPLFGYKLRESSRDRRRPVKKMVCELCGSNNFTKDSEGLFVCDYCRTKYTPEQAQKMLVEGTVRVDRSEDVDKFLRLAKSALEHSNPAEAYDYSNRALEIDTENSEAWFLKARAAGWSSNMISPRYTEMVGAFRTALANAPEDRKESMMKEAADELNNVAVTVHKISYQEVLDHPSVDSIWQDHITRADEAISMFLQAHQWGGGRQPLDNVVYVATNLFRGPQFVLPNGRATSRTLNQNGQVHFQAKIDEAGEKIRLIDPTYITPRPGTSSSRCFVITATMGDEGAFPVVVLRHYRETVLLPSSAGQPLVAWYEKHGPELAALIEKSTVLRLISFALVVVPATLFALLALRAKGLLLSQR
jgi:ribosomal protein L37AE/L43A